MDDLSQCSELFMLLAIMVSDKTGWVDELLKRYIALIYLFVQRLIIAGHIASLRRKLKPNAGLSLVLNAFSIGRQNV